MISDFNFAERNQGSPANLLIQKLKRSVAKDAGVTVIRVITDAFEKDPHCTIHSS